MFEWISENAANVVAISAALSTVCPEAGIVSKILNFVACNFGNAKNAK